MSTATKDTLYIEADDEITMIIDKVVSAKHKVVAVVLPKHATVFQSAVNMKLLKKAGVDAKKNLVLITSEPAIKSIAGLSGVHIAKTLTSKPAVPKKPKTTSNETTITTDDVDVPSDELKTSDETGEKDSPTTNEEETIELDNTEDLASDMVKSSSSKKKKLKFKIPDFSSFRLRMALSILALILVGVGWFFGFVVLPEAIVTINTDTSRVDVSSDFIAKDGLESADLENGVIPAKKIEIKKEDSVTVPATGEKNVGEKATGVMTLANCIQDSSGVTVPAGSGFSSGSTTFITSVALELGPSVIIGGNCDSASFPNFGSVKDVAVVASQPGPGANLDARSYTSSISGVLASGSDMTGGTTKLASVVSEEDIKKATDQLAGSSTADAVEELKAELNKQDFQPLVETLQESDAKNRNSAAADTEVSELTVTRTVTYSMSGVSSDDLSKLLDLKIQENLSDKSQDIRSNGLSSAVYRLIEKTSDTENTLNIRTVAVIGPEFDEASIKQEIAGKKRGEIEKLLEARKGVKSVSVEFSPFWVFQVPDKPSRITILINEQN